MKRYINADYFGWWSESEVAPFSSEQLSADILAMHSLPIREHASDRFASRKASRIDPRDYDTYCPSCGYQVDDTRCSCRGRQNLA